MNGVINLSMSIIENEAILNIVFMNKMASNICCQMLIKFPQSRFLSTQYLQIGMLTQIKQENYCWSCSVIISFQG